MASSAGASSAIDRVIDIAIYIEVCMIIAVAMIKYSCVDTIYTILYS